MEENMKNNEHELDSQITEPVEEEITQAIPKADEESASPKKSPMNKKALIGIIVGAAVVVAIVVALLLGLGGKNNNSHTCSFGEWTVVADATCTQDGSKERVCSCGEKETDTIAALGHDWKAPDCQSPKTCNKCSTTEGNPTDHEYTVEMAIPDALKSAASCTAQAVYYKSCTCGAVSNNDNDTFSNGPMLAHSYTKTSSTEADCENTASETYACSCGDTYTDNIGAALGHNIANATPEKLPVDGSVCEFVLVYTCSNEGCGKEIKGEHIYNHNYKASITTAPTCNEDGIKTLTCSCGDSYTESIAKNSTGHEWIKGDTVDGVRTDVCKHCSESKTVTVYIGTTTDSINSNDLKDTEIEINDANISLDEGVVDSIGDKSVTISAEKFSGDDVSDLLNPDQLAQVGDSPIYNFTISDGENNISQFGENNYVTITLPYTLGEDEDVDSIAIWFIGDNGELESIKAVYNNGYVTFQTNHFSYYTVTRLTPAERCALYGHNHAEQVFEGSCTSDGYILKVCVRCHATEKVITSVAQGHDYNITVKEATCTENGYSSYECKNCNYSYKTTQAAINHNWTVTKSEESTCSKNGYKTLGCDNCGAEITEYLPKLPHQMVEEKIVKEPTCTENGIKEIICQCGAKEQIEIPATNTHSYQNGVCTQCGHVSTTAVKLDGIVIRVENFTYSMSEKENQNSNWELTGKIEKVDLTELMIYVEDGELHGAAIGTVDYFDKWEGNTTTYALTAIIDDGYFYYHITGNKGSLGKNMVLNGKASLEEALGNSLGVSEDTSDEIISFVKDSLIPAMQTLVDSNSASIDEVVDKVLNVLFTIENKADGSHVISLDQDKIKALSKNLESLTVAELIEHYFGEGVVDDLYESVLNILNTTITDIPGIVNDNGIDLDKLLDECEGLCDMLGIPVSVEDIKDILYGEDYAKITIGMLIFGTEDNSYEEMIKDTVDMLREKNIYDLISPEYSEEIKDVVAEVVKLIDGKLGLAFTINPAGQIIDIEVDVLDLTVESGNNSHYINANVDISFTGRIDVTWGDIIGIVNGDMVSPREDMYKTEPDGYQYSTSGEMLYNGTYYQYSGQYAYSYLADYSRMYACISESNCGDWRRYDYAYATTGYEVSIRRLYGSSNFGDSNKYPNIELEYVTPIYTLLINENTYEIVELLMKEEGATAVYSDGTTKELTSTDFESLHNLYIAVFGEDSIKNTNRTDSLYFYYNSKTGEYSNTSQHNYEVEYDLLGDSCEDGVTSTYTCANCGDSYSNHYTHHNSQYNTIDLTEYDACYGEITISKCPCGEYFYAYINGCGWDSYNEYEDDNGNLVSVQAHYCSTCGLRSEISKYSVDIPGTCKKTEYCTIIVSVGERLVLNNEYTRTYTSHEYTVSATLNPGATSCEQGVTLTYTCKCGYSYTNNTTWHTTYVKEKIDLTALGSHCGGYAQIEGCACGYHSDLYINHSLCDLRDRYCDLWIENAIQGSQYTADGYNYFYYNAYILECAVTEPESCPFKIRYAQYWLDNGDCTATCYRVWQFGYNEKTGGYAYQYKLSTETRVYHNYNETSIANGVEYNCPRCGSYYHNKDYYDSNGRLIKSEVVAESTLGIGNKKYENVSEYVYNADGEYERYYYHNKTVRQNGSISENRSEYMYIFGEQYEILDYYCDGSYWYKYELTYDFSNGCNRTRVYTNSYGERNEYSENCCLNYWTVIEYPTCSQEGIEIRYCPVCNTEHERYFVEPDDHDWTYITEGHYYCFVCGLENVKPVSGNVIIEDLTSKYGNDTHYVVGYYVEKNLQFTYYVSLIDENGDEIFLEVDCIENDSPCSISFSKADVANALASMGLSLSDGYIRFTFVPYGSDGSFDYAITFTDELNVDVISDSVSFVEYIGSDERKSFSICPTESGYWIFTSMAQYDSWAEITDKNGNQIACDDDNGYNSNFRIYQYLEAGKTYTINVRWLSWSLQGNMPLIFIFEG